MDWLKEEITAQAEERGTDRLVRLNGRLDFQKPPYSVVLRLKSDRKFSVENANVRYNHRKNRLIVSWFSYPGQVLYPEIELSLPREAKLEAEISAVFLKGPLPVSCQAQKTIFIHRAEIERRVDLLEEK